MIDEKKLIKDFNLLLSKTFLGEITCTSQISVGEICSLINDQPKIDDWIMVSDRLPTKEEYQKNGGRFIVCDGNRVYQSLFDFYKNRFCFTRYVNPIKYELEEDKCVIKWKPLPEM